MLFLRNREAVSSATDIPTTLAQHVALADAARETRQHSIAAQHYRFASRIAETPEDRKMYETRAYYCQRVDRRRKLGVTGLEID